AESVIEAAILRKESRGAHSRTDFPKTLAEWQNNIVVKNKNGNIATEVIPVIK
ncbi:hypothetical protein HY612_05560, partial [Candidatus Roizmanbacteria bacterium]|nr:hypothetical protein [Candidatus Roizmanbacteria bacterium]